MFVCMRGWRRIRLLLIKVYISLKNSVALFSYSFSTLFSHFRLSWSNFCLRRLTGCPGDNIAATIRATCRYSATRSLPDSSSQANIRLIYRINIKSSWACFEIQHSAIASLHSLVSRSSLTVIVLFCSHSYSYFIINDCMEGIMTYILCFGI